MPKLWPPTPATIKELKHVLRNDLPMPKGWRTKTFHRVHGDLVIYVNPKLKLVAKAPSVLSHPPPPDDILAPTVQLVDGWVIQPLCTFEDRSGAFHALLRKIGEKNRYLWDLHLWNVGRWQGRPVLFDW